MSSSITITKTISQRRRSWGKGARWRARARKLKLLNLAKMLYERTDESTPHLPRNHRRAGRGGHRGRAQIGVPRRTPFATSVSTSRLPHVPGRYALVSRTFTAAELMLLTDAVQSRAFSWFCMAHRLTEGLASLGSCHQAAALPRTCTWKAASRCRTDRCSTWTPCTSHPPPPAGSLPLREARREQAPQPQGRPHLLRDAGVPHLSEGCYYLIAYNEARLLPQLPRRPHAGAAHHRRGGRAQRERIATFDAAAYTSRTFSMFGGETTPATLLVEESGHERHYRPLPGKDVESAPVDATHARVHVTWPPAPCSSAGSPSSAPPCA